MAEDAPITEETVRRESEGFSHVDPRESYTLDLASPIKTEGQERTSLTFRPCRPSHLRKMPVSGGNTGIGPLIELASKLCGVLVSVIEDLEPEDFRRVSELTAVFLSPLLVADPPESSDPNFDPRQTHEVELSRETVHRGNTVSSLRFRKCRVGDIKDIDGQVNIGDLVRIAARLTATDAGLIESLAPKDFVRVVGVATLFLRPFLETG